MLEVGERPRPIEVRLSPAEQIQIGPVDHHNSRHPRDLVTTRLISAPGTGCPISAWPIRLGMTQATLSRLAFLSSVIAASTRLGLARGARSGKPKDPSSSSCASARRLLQRSIEN